MKKPLEIFFANHDLDVVKNIFLRNLVSGNACLKKTKTHSFSEFLEKESHP